MEPDEKLWKLKYIAYSDAVAWRHVIDEYQRTPWGRKQRPRSVKCEKENFAVRQHLSEASGEHEAIQRQPKMTKRRVKRGKQIRAKCKTLFAEDLTEFIEKLKQQFPNSLNIHDVVAQPKRLILVRWMNWQTEWKTSWTRCVWKRFQTSVVCKMFLNRIFIKKDQLMEMKTFIQSESCNPL